MLREECQVVVSVGNVLASRQLIQLELNVCTMACLEAEVSVALSPVMMMPMLLGEWR
jgi:hypothetical protein